jgi:hypothetical protein
MLFKSVASGFLDAIQQPTWRNKSINKYIADGRMLLQVFVDVPEVKQAKLKWKWRKENWSNWILETLDAAGLVSERSSLKSEGSKQ